MSGGAAGGGGAADAPTRRILSLLVENQSGTLSRVSGLFSARGYNIVSLTVAPTHDKTLSRITLVTYGDDAKVEQITKQINKLIEVFKVTDITDEKHIARELMLIKVRTDGAMREECKRLADIFRGTIVNVTQEHYIVQVVGDRRKLDAFIAAVDSRHILEVARSGACGITCA